MNRNDVSEKTMYGPQYDELMADFTSHKDQWILEYTRMFFPEKMGQLRVLDIGCGSRSYLYELLPHAHMVVGTDYDWEPLRITKRFAKEQGLHVLFARARAEQIPFKDKLFNVLISFQVLEHTENAKQAFNELARLADDECLLFFSVPNGYGLSEIGRRLFHKLRGTRNPHQSRISYDQLLQFFQKNNFKIVNQYQIGLLSNLVLYFLEGFVLRFWLKKSDYWKFRQRYVNSRFYTALRKIDEAFFNHFPRLAGGWGFVCRR